MVHPPAEDMNPLTSIIRLFPWNNGIALSQGSMTARWMEWCASQGPHVEGIQSSIVLAQAQSLDRLQFDHYLHDPRTVSFLRRLLASDRETFLTESEWDDLGHQDILSITHVLVRLHILDQLVDALSFPPHPMLQFMPKVPFPRKFPNKLDRIFGHLKNWSEPIKGLCHAMLTASSRSRQSTLNAVSIFSASGLDIILPHNPTQDAITACNDILTLRRAFTHASASTLHTILSNAELLTFSVSWFSQRNIDFPDTPASLGQFLMDRAIQAGVILPDNFLDQFRSTEAAALFARMKVCFHVAGTVSPLVILIPTQWAKASFGREHLFTILYALGNERPATLLQVERAAWNAIMRIVCGSDAETEMQAFLREYDELKQAWRTSGITDLNLNFFDNALSSAPEVPRLPAPEEMAVPQIHTLPALPVSSTPASEMLPTMPELLEPELPEPELREPELPSLGIDIPEPERFAIPVDLPELATPDPALPAVATPDDGSLDVVSALHKALTGNYAANRVLEGSHVGETGVDDVEEMEWTLPGSQTLTERALDLTSRYIDQSQFIDGISPLTKIFRPETPEPIDTPLTEQELERINLSSLDLNHAFTTPPIHQPLVDPDAEGETDPDNETNMPDALGHQDEDVLMETRHSSPSPQTGSSPASSAITSPSSTARPLKSNPSGRGKSKTIVISSSSESEAESELSEPPSSPVPTATRSTRTSQGLPRHAPQAPSAPEPNPGPHFGTKTSMHGALRSEVKGPKNMVTTPAPPMVKTGHIMDYFSLNPTSKPKKFHFVTHENVAKVEFSVLKRVQELVEENYVEGRPRHHLPEARQIPYTPNTSVFFIIDYPDFVKLSPRDIQSIARTRHIVVEHVPQEDFGWSRETLSRLGSLSQNREIQAGQLRNDTKATGLLTVGTLDQLHAAADNRVLLSLSLPLGASGLVDTPRLWDLSSDRWAWLQTNGAAGFRKLTFLSDDTTWGTVGSRGAVSHIHLDDAGLCTSTQVLTSKKYWVIFDRDPALPDGDPRGDLGSIAWGPEFLDLYEHKVKGYLTAEAIEMVPGTLLLQRPNTLHYVLTMEHTITQGQHYYLSSCIQSSAHGIIHSFVRRYTITNQLHYQTPTLLRRLLCSSIDWYVSGQWNTGMETPPHVINVAAIDGLHDIISLGNLIEFATALDLRTYEDIILPEEERLEIEISMTRYRSFIRWYSENFGLRIEDSWVNPSYFFKHRLVSFGATVCDYFTKEHSTTQQQSRLNGITPFRVKKMFRGHLQRCWPDLQAVFDHLLAHPSSFLYHTGPPIRIIRKSDLHLLQEQLTAFSDDKDFLPAPISIPAQAPAPASEPAPQPAAPKRPHTPTKSSSSPSQQKISKRRK